VKIYKLERRDNVDYDQTAAMILVAENTAGARALAAENAGAEGSGEWKTAEVILLGEALKKFRQPTVIHVDVHYG